jgi:hypothetical protein
VRWARCLFSLSKVEAVVPKMLPGSNCIIDTADTEQGGYPETKRGTHNWMICAEPLARLVGRPAVQIRQVGRTSEWL